MSTYENVRRAHVVQERMSSSQHSAAGQAAGYQYQSELALLRLLQRRQPRLVLFTERFDDFEIEDGDGPLDIVQAKHHLRGGELTDTSADLWRTMNAWMSLIARLDVDEIPSFLLLTTSTAPAGSAASLLHDGQDRDAEAALERLRAVAGRDEGATTQAWRTRFCDLPDDQQRLLVEHITVADEQPKLIDVQAQLEAEFSSTVRPEHRVGLVNSLRGWWFGQIARMLSGAQQGVAIEDVWSQLYELRDSYHVDNLPFDYNVPEPSEDEEQHYVASTFTSQLRIVDIAEARIKLAIRDYHRAYANASLWAREGLLLPGELTSYEQRIKDEWERHFERMRQDIGDDSTDDAMRTAGRKLWEFLDDGGMMPRLRPLLDEVTVTRGTLHTLADDERIGWHPEFRERLRELIVQLAE